MGSDGAPDGGDGKFVHQAFPENAAVLYVLLQQFVGQAGIAEKIRHVIINAAHLADALHQEIVSVFGAVGLAEDDNFSPLQRDHRLDGEHFAKGGHRFRDTAAFFQIFQCVQQSHNLDLSLCAVQFGDNFLRGKIPVDELAGIGYQSPLTDGNALAVHHMDLSLIFFRCHAGALIGAGEFAGKGNDNGGVSRFRDFSVGFLKFKGGKLAGSGQFVRLDQLFIEFGVGQIHAV